MPLDDEESNHRLAAAAPRRARRDLAPGADAPRLRRGRRRLRARRSPTSRSTSRSTAWGPTGTPPRSSPASPGPRRRRVRRRPWLAQAAARPRDADLRQAQRLAPDPARRHGRGQGADARARASPGPTRRSPPRCWTASAWRSSPTPRPSMADEVWLAPPRRDRVVADGQAHRAHRHPAHRHGPRGGARAARAPGGPCLRARALLAALARPRDGAARGPRALGAARRPPGVGLRRVRGPHHAGDPRAAPGLVPVARRRARRREPRRRRRPLRPRHRRGCAPPTATSRSSPTATSCARWPRAGSTRRWPSADTCTSARARSRCSPTSARSPSSAAGTASRSARDAPASLRAERGRSACDRAAARSG